jgi:ribosome maturation factor RimP
MLLPIEQKVWDLIVDGVADLGLRLVRIKYMTNPKQRSTLQIMIEPFESTLENRLSVNVDECASVSRMTAAILDVEDPISDAYNLEVSSTGLNRPLVAQEDFVIYKGAKIKLELNTPVEAQKRFTGIIEGYDVEAEELDFMELETSKKVKIPYDYMKKAALYYTQAEIDELFKEDKGD